MANRSGRLAAGAAGLLRHALRHTRQRPSGPAALLAGFLLVYCCWQLLAPAEGREITGELLFFPIDLAATWCCWRAARRCTGWPRLRRAWLLIAFSLLSWTAADLIYTVYDVAGATPYPSPADGFYLLFYPLMLAGILSFPSGRRGRSERMRLALDLAIVTVGGSGAVIYMVLGPQATADGNSLTQTVFSVAYPVGDLILLVALASALLRTAAPSAWRSLRLLAAGLSLLVLADLVSGYLSLRGDYHSGDSVDLVWVLALALFALAGAAQAPVAQPEPITRSPRQVGWLPYAAVAAGFGVLLYADRDGGFYPLRLLIMVTLVLATLVALRQLLGQHELLDAQAELRHQALHDGLTGLANRTLLHDRLENAARRSERNQETVAVLMLDIDDFKLVNDSLGHAAGDELLVEIAGRLAAVARPGDTVARLGGDEFALVLDGRLDQPELVAIAERVLALFMQPFLVSGSPRRVDASVGISHDRGRAAASATDLLREADNALYRAKANGKGRFDIFDTVLRDDMLRHIELGGALSRALDEGALEVCYQPIVTADGGDTLALEALLRWPNSLDAVQPDEFISLAEESGLIVQIDEWVLGQAAAHLARLRAHDPDALPLGMFVNISPRDLGEPGFPALVATTTAAHGLQPADVTFELTERVFIDDHNPAVSRNLTELTAQGGKLVLDDFGTGYSALSSLQRFPLAAVKIDRCFISPIRAASDQAPIVQGIIGLAHTLGLTVIAEGIETQTQLDYLRLLGCDAVQGYLTGRPLPAAEQRPPVASLLGTTVSV